MIKKIIVVMAFVFVLFGCANDNTNQEVSTKEYRVTDATELTIFQFERRKNIEVTLLDGEEQKIVFKTEEKLLPYLNCFSLYMLICYCKVQILLLLSLLFLL